MQHGPHSTAPAQNNSFVFPCAAAVFCFRPFGKWRSAFPLTHFYPSTGFGLQFIPLKRFKILIY